MLKKTQLIACAGLLALAATNVSASYISTFDVAGDFSLTGFADGSGALAGPTVLDITNPTGSYTLDLPTPGTSYDWFIEVDSLSLDLYGDSTPEFSFGHFGPIFAGHYAMPTPAWSGSYNFGDVAIPGRTFSGIPLGGYTVQNAVVDWAISTTGTDITQIVLTLSADNLATTVNWDLWRLDSIPPAGTIGVIDGSFTANFSVTAVPEPATLLLMGVGLLGLGGRFRRSLLS